MPKIATVNSNNTSYTVTDGLFKKSYLFSNCTTNLVTNLDGSRSFYLVNGNETIVTVSNTLNSEFTGNTIFGTANPDIAQANSQSYIGSTNGVVSASAIVRVLPSMVLASYTQLQLQTLYDNQTGLAAPDFVPQAVTDYANSLNITGYKVYLGLNTWYFTTTSASVTLSSWTSFGGSKSAFGATIVANGVITYK